MTDEALDARLPADGTLLTARGVRSREALLSAARKLFKTQGYANTKIVDITTEAGRALGSFYTYFENKQEVLEQLAEDFKAEVQGRVTAIDMARPDRYAIMCDLCRAYWTTCRDHSAELAAIFQASMIDEHFASRWKQIRADSRQAMADMIVTVAKLGIADNPEPLATASALGAMMDYFCYVWLVEGGEAEQSMITDDVAIETMARVMYRAIFAAPESECETT
jgi:AcrR family transcriptional regulator